MGTIREKSLLENEDFLCELNKAFPEKSYSIFGCGFAGTECLMLLKKLKRNVICCWDNAKDRWGGYFEGYIVFSPDEIKKGGPQILICTVRYHSEIKKQLEGKGLREGEDFYDYHSICLKIGKYLKESVGVEILEKNKGEVI